MRSPLSYILCTGAICAAIALPPVWIGAAILAALITELLAVPRPPRQ